MKSTEENFQEIIMKSILRVFACFTCFIYSLLMITSCSSNDDNNFAKRESIDILFSDIYPDKEKKRDIIFSETDSDETESWEESRRYDSIFEKSLIQDGISQFHPVVVGGILIGGSYGGKWFCANEFAQELTGEEIYKLYGLNAYIGETKGAKVVPETDQWHGPYAEFVDLDHDFADGPVIAMNGMWDGLPRKPVTQTGNDDTYKAIINGLLEECNLYDADIEILQNYRIDFEGDGIDEVVLYAENKKTNKNDWPFDERKGCFSILVLRKIVNGSVENYVLRCDVHPEETDPDGLNRRLRYIFPIVGFADLNGDGKIELVSSWQYYEGISYEVFEIFDDGVKSVVANGYGA